MIMRADRPRSSGTASHPPGAPGTYGHRTRQTGVWLADCPLGVDECAKGDGLLEVCPPAGADLGGYELTSGDCPYREWCVPAAVVNTWPVRQLTGAEEGALAEQADAQRFRDHPELLAGLVDKYGTGCPGGHGTWRTSWASLSASPSIRASISGPRSGCYWAACSIRRIFVARMVRAHLSLAVR